MLPVDPTEKYNMLVFFVTMFELLWMHRNKIWQGDPLPDWTAVSSHANQTAKRYQERKGQGVLCHAARHAERNSTSWKRPVDGELKMNFDAVFKNGKTAIGIILRNCRGKLRGLGSTTSAMKMHSVPKLISGYPSPPNRC